MVIIEPGSALKDTERSRPNDAAPRPSPRWIAHRGGRTLVARSVPPPVHVMAPPGELRMCPVYACNRLAGPGEEVALTLRRRRRARRPLFPWAAARTGSEWRGVGLCLELVRSPPQCLSPCSIPLLSPAFSPGHSSSPASKLPHRGTSFDSRHFVLQLSDHTIASSSINQSTTCRQ